jgi:hypothetical protein
MSPNSQPFPVSDRPGILTSFHGGLACARTQLVLPSFGTKFATQTERFVKFGRDSGRSVHNPLGIMRAAFGAEPGG